MLPAIWPGDLLTVRRCDLSELEPGQIALYRRGGKLTAHRILRLAGDRLITRGDSVPSFDPPVEASQIVGQVVSVSRAGQSLRPQQTTWQQLASAMLRRSDLLMRVTLFLSRRMRRSWDMHPSWTNSPELPALKP